MRTSISDQLLTEVLQRYPLEDLRLLGTIEASRRNDNFLVEDADGQRYVLRRYRRNVDPRRIEFQLRFQQALRSRGFPTSDVIATETGDVLVDSEDGPWVLFSFVEGEEYDFDNPLQVQEAGRRLAEFHTTAASIAVDEVVAEENQDVQHWWAQGDKEIDGLALLFEGEDAEGDLSFLRTWLETLRSEWPFARLNALPSGWVHGDYHGRNAVFVGDAMAGLFDFDALHHGFLIEDVALGLFMFCREYRGSTRLRTDAVRLFLGGYEERLPLTESEREALPVMVALVWAPTESYHAMLLRDGEDSLVFFRRFVYLMQELEREMERLAFELADLPGDAFPEERP